MGEFMQAESVLTLVRVQTTRSAATATAHMGWRRSRACSAVKAGAAWAQRRSCRPSIEAICRRPVGPADRSWIPSSHARILQSVF